MKSSSGLINLVHPLVNQLGNKVRPIIRFRTCLAYSDFLAFVKQSDLPYALQLADEAFFIGFPAVDGKEWFDDAANLPIARSAMLASIPSVVLGLAVFLLPSVGETHAQRRAEQCGFQIVHP